MERYLEFRIDEQTTELKMEAFLKKNAGLTNQTDTYETETPLSVRYVRLLFTEINSQAAGNAIGLKEFEIYGIQSEAKYQVEAAEAVEGITVDKGTEAADLNLPKLVSVQLKRNGSETAKTVQMPVVWNTENYNAAADGVYTLEGIISLNGTCLLYTSPSPRDA